MHQLGYYILQTNGYKMTEQISKLTIEKLFLLNKWQIQCLCLKRLFQIIHCSHKAKSAWMEHFYILLEQRVNSQFLKFQHFHYDFQESILFDPNFKLFPLCSSCQNAKSSAWSLFALQAYSTTQSQTSQSDQDEFS